MLRVLTLSTLFPSAHRPELGRFVERQTQQLARMADVDVRVIAPRGLPPGPLARLDRYRHTDELPDEEQWRGLHVRRPRFTNIPLTHGRFHASMLTRALAQVLADMRRTFDFDIIDAEFFFPDGPAATALGRIFDVPVSIKARGGDIHHWGGSPATARRVIAAGLMASGLLAVSDALRDDMIAMGMPGDRILVHRTGVDHDAFARHDRATAKAMLGIQGPLVVAVGALVARKGHDIVIDAVARLPGVALHIVGAGPERDRLARRIADHGIGARVTLAGQQSHDMLPTLLAAADVMALASASEGLANAWVEAMAAGTPVVIPDIGGAREAVDRPAAGRIVPRDAAAFATAIAGLIADPPPPSAVRAAAERFSWDTNATALRAHLERLVEAYRRERSAPLSG